MSNGFSDGFTAMGDAIRRIFTGYDTKNETDKNSVSNLEKVSGQKIDPNLTNGSQGLVGDVLGLFGIKGGMNTVNDSMQWVLIAVVGFGILYLFKD